MIKPLQVVSDGYLTASGATKKVLILALAGYLSFSTITPPDPPDYGAGGGTHYYQEYDKIPRRNSLQAQIIREDEEILAIIKVMALCL